MPGLFNGAFNSTINLVHRKRLDLGSGNSKQDKELARIIADALASGDAVQAEAIHANLNQSGGSAKAGATLVFATSSGTVGATINGVNVEAASGSGTDVEDAALAAATINASTDALVAGFVRASEYAATLTLSSTVAGSKVVIRIGSGGKAKAFNFKAVATSAAVLEMGDFSISGNDTADALALATAINAMPVCNQYVRAESVAGVCYLYAMDRSTSSKAVMTSGITLTAAFAGVARCHVECLVPGALGNAITFAARGTNVTVANSNSRLVGGVGGVSGTTKRAALRGIS